MNYDEAAILLSAISANDGREVNEGAARAWAAALPDVALGDALQVLPSYYRAATSARFNRIYPGDVLELVAGMHSNARRALARAAFVDGADHEASVRGALEARQRYDAEHTIPQIESPSVQGEGWIYQP